MFGAYEKEEEIDYKEKSEPGHRYYGLLENIAINYDLEVDENWISTYECYNQIDLPKKLESLHITNGSNIFSLAHSIKGTPINWKWHALTKEKVIYEDTRGKYSALSRDPMTKADIMSIYHNIKEEGMKINLFVTDSPNIDYVVLGIRTLTKGGAMIMPYSNNSMYPICQTFFKEANIYNTVFGPYVIAEDFRGITELKMKKLFEYLPLKHKYKLLPEKPLEKRVSKIDATIHDLFHTSAAVQHKIDQWKKANRFIV